jgi:DNA-binding NtrC family response regulator
MNKVVSPIHTVTLADDDIDDRDLFVEAMSLVDSQISINTVKDGEELMDYLNTNTVKPGLIFLDLNMPRKNGKECLVEIQESVDLKTIPVVIYTTSLNPRDVEYCMSKGAFHFIRKPNSFEELKEMLFRFFNDIKNESARKITGNIIIKASNE